MKPFHLVLILVFIFSTRCIAANQPDWQKQGPTLGSKSASFSLPIERLSNKLYVQVDLGGKPRRFVVDSGSPSMIDSALAEELGLKAVGTNKGIDAHGKVIESQIVQADIKLDDVQFNKVPMFTADFASSPATKVFIGDGVLGSELYPLGLWQFDLKNNRLSFSTNKKQLAYIKQSKAFKLNQFGYPFMPLLDVQFAKKSRSIALFDTGSPTYFAISAADFNGTKNTKGLGKVITGYGSAGYSLGGQAPFEQQIMVQLNQLKIDKLKMGKVPAIKRPQNPSLIGVKMLDRFIITLNAANQTAYFYEFNDDGYSHTSFGFTLAFEPNIQVASVWDKSPAHKAGLKPGMVIKSVNGVPIDLSVSGIRSLVNYMEEDEIEISWQDKKVTLVKEKLL